MTDLRVAISRSGKTYTLLDDYTFPEEGMLVNAGFRTDFASVPKGLWFVFPPVSFYAKAALLHDWCYCNGFRIGMTRRQADDMFLRQMRRDGVGYRTRYTMWVAVRLFGARFWRY